MKKYAIIIILITISTTGLIAQTDTVISTFWNPVPSNYEVQQALEVESLFPMFFYGGFHFAACYRYYRFRVRISVINGGRYDAELAGINNSSAKFERLYKTSPGIFFGYNVWKNLEVYTYLEFHTFAIEQKSTGIQKDLHSVDSGIATSYQFFIGRYLYLQPGLHIYLRENNSLDFNGTVYHIPNIDISPVIRIGIRYWRKT